MKKTAFFLAALVMVSCLALFVSADAGPTMVPTTYIGELDLHGLDSDGNWIILDSSAGFMVRDYDGKISIYAKEFEYIPAGDDPITTLTMAGADFLYCKFDVSFQNRRYSRWTIYRDANEYFGVNTEDNRIDENGAYVLIADEAKKNQSVTALYYNSSYTIKQSVVKLKGVDQNGFLTLEGQMPELSVFPAALIAEDGNCVGFVTGMEDGVPIAFALHYDHFGEVSALGIILGAAGGLLFAAAVVAAIVLLRRKNAKMKKQSAAQVQPKFPDIPSSGDTGPESGGSFCLIGESDIMAGKEFPIPAGGVLMAGKMPGCAIRFPDTVKSVSREHAELRNNNGQIYVRDNGSTNGTYLRAPGESIKKLSPNEYYPVAANSVIYFAEPKFGFRVIAK